MNKYGCTDAFKTIDNVVKIIQDLRQLETKFSTMTDWNIIETVMEDRLVDSLGKNEG